MNLKYLAGSLVILALAFPNSAPAATMAWGGYNWNVYNGTGMLGQRFAPREVAIGPKHHYLHVGVNGGTGGGVGMRLGALTGRWSVTFRMTSGPGKYAILLWPVTGTRPELDFAEDKPVDHYRKWCTATWHPASAKKIHVVSNGRYSKWHRATVVVRRGSSRLFLDGHLRAVFPSPGVPMRLAIQTAAVAGSTGKATLIVRHVSAP